MTDTAPDASQATKMDSYTRKIFSEYLQARNQLQNITPEMLEIFSDGKIDVLGRAASGLRKMAPDHPDLPMIYRAIHDLKRLASPGDGVRRGTGRKPTISLPLGDVPAADLERIQSSHHKSRQEHLTYTYREILGAARRAGLQEVLNREALMAFRAEIDARELSAKTVLTKMRDCMALAELWNVDLETVTLLANERRAARNIADREPSARHAAFRAAPLTPLDYARLARTSSEEAYRCQGNRQSIHRLFVTAAALALLSLIPERVADILKLVVGRDVVRDGRGWSSSYFSSKSEVDRSIDYLPAQLTPYLDDLVLLGAGPGPQGCDLARLYRLRADSMGPLFARTDLRRAYSPTPIFQLVKERTGHGPHAARKAMADYLVEMGGTRAEIMDLLGHRRASTSERHYEVRAAAIRRKRTVESIDSLREGLAQHEMRLPSGHLVDLSRICRDLDRASQG